MAVTPSGSRPNERAEVDAFLGRAVDPRTRQLEIGVLEDPFHGGTPHPSGGPLNHSKAHALHPLLAGTGHASRNDAMAAEPPRGDLRRGGAWHGRPETIRRSLWGRFREGPSRQPVLLAVVRLFANRAIASGMFHRLGTLIPFSSPMMVGWVIVVGMAVSGKASNVRVAQQLRTPARFRLLTWWCGRVSARLMHGL